MIAWTPSGSLMGLGSVLIRPEQALKPLTYTAYRLLLAERIDRMVGREDPEDARALLLVVEENEPLSVASRPETAGEILAEHSSWLTERAGFRLEEARPPFCHSPETEAAMAEERLEDFLGTLYHVSH